MKSDYIRRFLMLSALALALPASSVMAAPEEPVGRGGQGCDMGRMEPGAGHGMGFAGHGLHRLGLTAEQQKQLRLLQDAQEDAIRPLMRSLREERIALRDLTVSDSYDAKKAAEISGRIGQLHGKLALIMAEGRGKMLASLTPEQKAKFKELPMMRRHRRD